MPFPLVGNKITTSKIVAASHCEHTVLLLSDFVIERHP